jgi:hypothetical protein
VLLLLLAEVGSSVIPFSSCSPFTSLTEWGENQWK